LLGTFSDEIQRYRALVLSQLQRRDNNALAVPHGQAISPKYLIYTPFQPDFQAMALTPQDIARVAHLARLALRPDETERTLGQLNGFFRLVEQMQAVNTDGVEPLAHPAAVLGQVALRLREDIATEPNQRDASQVSAPAVENGLFLVPKVIE
jgi:aspartyl-tRNA(Asn)/glutamyl-tRNA(Gln) amidotransferase subunit C